MEARNKKIAELEKKLRELENNKLAYIAAVKSVSGWMKIGPMITTDIVTKIKLGDENQQPLVDTVIDEFGNPALHYFIKLLKSPNENQKSKIEYAIEQLLKTEDANFTIKNNDKKNAIDLALEVGEECIELMRANLLNEEAETKFNQELELARARYINSKSNKDNNNNSNNSSNEHSPNQNKINEFHINELHKAVESKNYAAIKTLLELPDSIDLLLIPNANGKTIIDIALENDNEIALVAMEEGVRLPLPKRIFQSELLKARIIQAIKTQNEILAVQCYNQHFKDYSGSHSYNLVVKFAELAKSVGNEFLIQVFDKQLSHRFGVIDLKDYAFKASKSEIKSATNTIDQHNHVKYYGKIDTNQAKQKLLLLLAQGIDNPYLVRYSVTVNQLIITRLANGIVENIPTHAFLDPKHKINFDDKEEIETLVKSIVKVFDYMVANKLSFNDLPDKNIGLMKNDSIKPASLFFINDTEYGQKYIKKPNLSELKQEEIKSVQQVQINKSGLFNHNNVGRDVEDEENRNVVPELKQEQAKPVQVNKPGLFNHNSAAREVDDEDDQLLINLNFG